MRVICWLIMLFSVLFVNAQVDYTSEWRDLFSYNQVLALDKSPSSFYALTENAVFSYDYGSSEIQKISSVNGLSGGNTSAINYDEANQVLAIGYETGLLELVTSNGSVKKVVDIENSDISLEKAINSIVSYDNKLLLALEFGIVVYDLLSLEFGDTYFIGENSTSVNVTDVLIQNDKIYATSSDGVYIANLSDNLNDSSNWVKYSDGIYSNLTNFNEKVYLTKDKILYEILSDNSLVVKVTLSSNIIDTSNSELNIALVTNKQAFVYDVDFSLIASSNSTSYNFGSVVLNNTDLFIGSGSAGVLSSSISSINDFEEIAPIGPVSNKLFSITVHEKDVWCVYGGIAPWFAPLNNKKGISHFNGADWVEILYGDPNGVDKAQDLLHVTVDPENSSKVYVSSWGQVIGDVDDTDGGGVLVIEDNQYLDFWNAVNTNLGINEGLTNITLPDLLTYTSTRIYGTKFDNEGNMWVLNSGVSDGSGFFKKRTKEGVWTSHVSENQGKEYTHLEIDLQGNIWAGSRNTGLHVYNESLSEKISMVGESQGIPNDNVRCLAVGLDNNVWIGTASGLVLFSDVDNVFESDVVYPEAVIIDGADGASKLLDGLVINDIKVDGAGNVWFATGSGGVLQTDATGKNTLRGFNIDNSPLPSNNVLSIGIDHESGEVYFGTQNGIVSYNAGVIGYGDELTDVYAYPNPVLKNHSKVTIVGKGSNLPEGTNIKILDVAGSLVYESNALAEQSEYGGKFVWDKRNLAGAKVASGVYIVLLYNADGQQTSSTKIAIVN